MITRKINSAVRIGSMMIVILAVLTYVLFFISPVAVTAAEPLSLAGQYIIKNGDTLYKISLKYNTTVYELKKINGLTSNMIFPGQILVVPSGFRTYIIKRGDTLYYIGLEFGATVKEIKNANGLKSDLIMPGQVLRIPIKSPRTLSEVLEGIGVYKPGNKLYIVADKSDHTLSIFYSQTWLKSYHMELGDSGPGDKNVTGDHKTPEGNFFICQAAVLDPPQKYFGTRWLRLSYPTYEDAERGLNKGIISWQTYNSIINALDNFEIPPQHTALGGGVGIHGGDSPELGRDWTWGCLGLKDSDIEEFYKYIGLGTRITIQK
jgi:LysM repeat protein